MSSSQALGGNSRPGRILGPSLDRIVKNVAWRKHSNLVSSCKSVLDRLQSLTDLTIPDPDSSLVGFSKSDADFVLEPLVLAVESSSVKVVEPTLECIQKLILQGLIGGTINHFDENNAGSSFLTRMLDSLCKCGGLGDEEIEVSLLKIFVYVIRSPLLWVSGECLIEIVKSCYNVYLGSQSATNQIRAKAALYQIINIVYVRVEANSIDVIVDPVTVGKLLEISDKSMNELNLVISVQNFINEITETSIDVSNASSFTLGQSKVEKNDVSGSNTLKENLGDDLKEESSIGDCIFGELGISLFKYLCKFSMKFSAQDDSEDHLLLRGKVLSLELLNIIMGNASQIWLTNDRFLGAIKQYLCLSLLKNCALSVMSIFELLCSIFFSLLSRFRSGLKAEIGIFFPMLILRVLENNLQPNFIQKMSVLNLLDKICQDSQLILDIFVNYDCDMDAPNVFERIVNDLLKIALGPPPGSNTTLTPAQDLSFRFESVKCLVKIITAMGFWMDQQLRTSDSSPLKSPEEDISPDIQASQEEDYGMHSEINSESEAMTFEQRRAYKVEFQKGISLFNRKPSKGIHFLISTRKIGDSPEEVAAFLRNTIGLKETVVGDYLGDWDEFPLKVMHSYVDSFNFQGMEFGKAIRFFLRGFRLPGEAQKIDRIMEKFAERYCKCNPSAFSRADTAYVLAYSVIMLNTDAHNSMVKDKMSKGDFIRNNRGIDDGKDLPEEYLGSLYDDIVKNEIKMSSETLASQNKQTISINKRLGLESILNLVIWKKAEEKPLGANDALIKNIQEQFKEKAGKSESVYYDMTDVAILRFMMEACWAPMLAAFSVNLDRSDDKSATSQCLLGFRRAVHVTSIMNMQTQRDAFVTSIAKFTYLHCAADMKQKNVDAVKTIITVAIEDGDYLQEAWEHILTCLSRFEHLQLLGEGAPPDSSFLTIPRPEMENKQQKTPGFPSLKKKGTNLQNPSMVAVVRGGSYDSATLPVNNSGLVTPEQINHFISNLNLLDQIGNSELNHIFAHSQRLNSEAIVSFVKALCKVSMIELQSPTDPRVFSLTKIVEIAHYNMDRIRLVWSRIWSVLSDFFVSVGLSENLSVAIFVMDSLRQLAMKFLEREELANYNFQNEFLRPFVTVMQKSSSAEIRELIVRCISQMVLSRVKNVKSGWKSVFTVFTTAAADEHKNIVLLAFQTMEKIVRDYFPYITETETTTFTDCVRCLLTFTQSKFSSDASLNAIAFLRFCAVKLAEGLIQESDSICVNQDGNGAHISTSKNDHECFWIPLLSGLSKLTSDARPAIRKGSLEVLFNILKDHGHLFSQDFWTIIFDSVILSIFDDAQRLKNHTDEKDAIASFEYKLMQSEESSWSPETCVLGIQCLVDLFISFYDVVQSQLPSVILIFTNHIKNPNPSLANTGISALVQLANKLGKMLSENDWKEIFKSLHNAATSTVPGFLKLLKIMNDIEVPDSDQTYPDTELFPDNGVDADDLDGDSLPTASYVIARTKGHIAVQLLITQVAMGLYKTHSQYLTSPNIIILLEILSSVASQSSEINAKASLLQKFRRVCSILDISDPPVVHFENESHQTYLNFLQSLLLDKSSLSQEIGVEFQLVLVCENIINIYLHCANDGSGEDHLSLKELPHQTLPLGSSKKEELDTRTPLLVLAIRVLSNLEKQTFARYVSRFFPSLVKLIRCEHTSGEVPRVLSNIFQSAIGPIITDP